MLVGRSALQAPIKLDDFRQRSEVERLIDRCRTSFGAPLGTVTRGLIRRAIFAPGDESWDEAHGVIVVPNVTLWEAVLMYSDYHVMASPRMIAQQSGDDRVEIVRSHWSAIPDYDQIVTSLRRLLKEAGL